MWDEEVESGYYNTSNGNPVSDSSYIRSKNFIEVLDNKNYYIKSPINCSLLFYDANYNFISSLIGKMNVNFTTPENCKYMKFYPYYQYGTTYNNDISISYLPQTEDVLALGYIRITYLDNANIKKEFVMTHNKVDLGGLSWSFLIGYGFYSNAINDIKTNTLNIICSKYQNNGTQSWVEKNIFISNTKYVAIVDNSYPNTSTFKSSLSGVYLTYELANPIVVDISSALSDNDIILGRLEGSGVITFENTNKVALPYKYLVQYK